MPARAGWSREQLINAFKLYCDMPFGKMHSLEGAEGFSPLNAAAQSAAFRPGPLTCTSDLPPTY